jgi:aspartyl-tRNA(Asn)/glutamyl-tRNA(Gln) amidotransferase subunit B
LNEQGASFETFALPANILAALIDLVDSGKVNFSVASAKLLPALLESPGDPLALAEKMNLIQVSDSAELETWVTGALESMPDKVSEYKKGKKGLIGLFVGEVKKRSKGKADPRIVTQLLEEKLNA